MINLIILLATLILFFGFFVLTMVEARMGRRVFAGTREHLDSYMARVFFIVQHVHWGDFLSHLVQSIGTRIAHDIAHSILMLVRFIERQLSRTVRYMNERRPNLLAPVPSRTSPFEQTINYLQGMIQRTRKQKAQQHKLEKAPEGLKKSEKMIV